VFSFLTLNPGTHFSLTHSLHEKIFLVDGEIAILGGRNVSDSSLSGKDLEVQIEGPVVGQVQDHFKRMFDFVTQLKLNSNFKSKKNKLIRNEKLLNAKFSKSNKNYFPDLEIFNENTSARILTHEAVIHHYENKMNMKERQIQSDDILDTIIKFDFKKLRAYNYFLIFTDRYRNFLEENLANSKSIEMISNGRESAKFTMDWGYLSSIPDALDLVKKGLELYQWERNQKLNYVHEKVLIFDEDHVIIGSHNFAAGSTGVSNEIVIDFKSSEIAGRLIEVFEDEKNNSTKTKKADIESLERENVLYADTIELSRKKLIHSFILELF
jgi:putative cardiolipin synthase